MTTDKDIDIFINWLVDRDYFNEFITSFKTKNNIVFNVFFELKRYLKETNVIDFLSVGYEDDKKTQDWIEYYDFKTPNVNRFIPRKGNYIVYSITRNKVTCQYVSIVDKVELLGDVYIYEFCSVCIKSDDEEMIGVMEYDMEFCRNEDDGVTLFRLATNEEIKILDEYLKEDGLMFDANIFKLVEI